MNAKTSARIEKCVFFLALIIIIIGVNFVFFKYFMPKHVGDTPSLKVEEIGNTVVLRYTESEESYSIKGIEKGGQFERVDGLHVFQNPDYCVFDGGDTYEIVNSSGEVVASVKLIEAKELEHELLEVDAATYTQGILKVPSTCTRLRVYTSVEGGEKPMSIQIEDREAPLDLVLDNVSITAPDMSPVLYSLSKAPVNLTVKGSVTLEGGKNPYNASDVSNMDRFLDTLDTSANAYCVVMVSAIGGAASIYKGTEYYATMFKGITGLQLATMENAWNKVEELFNGEDGAAGLDGIAAVQLQGDLNIVSVEGSYLKLLGGQGGRGGDGVDGFINTTRGGRGGNGAPGLICDRLVNGLGSRFFVEAGPGGEGGAGGKNVVGEQGPYGNYGGSLENKVIISKTEINLDR